MFLIPEGDFFLTWLSRSLTLHFFDSEVAAPCMQSDRIGDFVCKAWRLWTRPPPCGSCRCPLSRATRVGTPCMAERSTPWLLFQAHFLFHQESQKRRTGNRSPCSSVHIGVTGLNAQKRFRAGLKMKGSQAVEDFNRQSCPVVHDHRRAQLEPRLIHRIQSIHPSKQHGCMR